MAEAPVNAGKQIMALGRQYWFFFLCSLTLGAIVAHIFGQQALAQESSDVVGNEIQTLLNQEISQNMENATVPSPESAPSIESAPTQPTGTTQEKPSEEPGETEEPASSVEINGDKVEFLTEKNKVIAEGNVVITKDPVKLYADRVEFDRTTNVALAEGHVILMQGNGQMIGDRMSFNYSTMKGEFYNAKIDSHPFYGSGAKIAKIGDNHIVMEKGHFTTCDHDKAHFQMVSRKIDIYPGDKAVARNVRMLVGNFPLIYIPRYTQNISDKKPRVTYTPGYDKQWGAFLLTQWRYYFHDDFKGVIHLDYRERKDFAWGIDNNYKTKKYGQGMIRTYYMLERDVGASHHFWQPRLTPTPEHERFRAEWRHKWTIDKNTDAIWQYSKLSDENFMKDYFKRQQQEDTTSASTYFLLTRNFTGGVVSLRTDKRVNRFETLTERLPEIRYDLSSMEIADSGFYIRNLSTFSNFSQKLARPSEDRKETMRVHFDNEVSYPMKISFIELTPFVGGSQTYYSKTKDPFQYNTLRGLFRTGADLSTKFYRIFDLETNKLGLDIHRLRHIITPSIGYEYAHEPTSPPTLFDQFDEIDAKTNGHGLVFGIENKLQTKRRDKSVDLFRSLVSTDFKLKEDNAKGGFNSVSTDVEITPYHWLTLEETTTYDTIAEKWQTVNLDLSLFKASDKFYMTLGKHWAGEHQDSLVSEIGYRINQKWKFVIEDQFDLDTGILEIQEYSVKRDLHDWIMEVNFNETRGSGSEIWVVFTLKAFPEMGFDFGTGFNKRKAGTQSSVGP